MTPQEIFNHIEAFDNIQRRNYLKTLSETEKDAYRKFMKVKSVLKSRNKNNETKKAYNENQKKLMNDVRNKDRENDRIKQQIYNKTYRNKLKEQKENINAKLNLSNKLTDAIKAKKARMVMKKLKDDNTKSIASSIINDIVDTIPKQVALKKNRERVAKSRANAKIKRTINL
jgi:hypothetical protein